MKKLSKKELNNLDFEINFLENVLNDNPNYTDALILLGDNYTKRGMYNKGLMIDLRLVKLLPLDPVAHYNLACSYSLLNNIDDGFGALKNALKLGYKDFRHMEKDPDLDNLRKDSRYIGLLQTRRILK